MFLPEQHIRASTNVSGCGSFDIRSTVVKNTFRRLPSFGQQ